MRKDDRSLLSVFRQSSPVAVCLPLTFLFQMFALLGFLRKMQILRIVGVGYEQLSPLQRAAAWMLLPDPRWNSERYMALALAIAMMHNFQSRAEPQDVKIPALPTLALSAKQCVCMSPVFFSLIPGVPRSLTLSPTVLVWSWAQKEAMLLCSQQARDAAGPTLSPAVISSPSLPLSSAGHVSRAPPCLAQPSEPDAFVTPPPGEHSWRFPGSPGLEMPRSQAAEPQRCSHRPFTEQMQSACPPACLRLSGRGSKASCVGWKAGTVKGTT